jgi:DNA-binding LytR/AlgR family response regulator
VDVPLRVLVCEDQHEDARLLLNLIAASPVATVATHYSNAEDCFRDFYPGAFHVGFFDILLGDSSGIETARAVRERDPAIVLAFTTSSDEYTRESYGLGALKYLLKPVQAADINETLELATYKRRAAESVALPQNGTQVEVALDDILYFEQRRHDITAHTISTPVKISRGLSLDDLVKMLPSPPFFRCHRSYIVNFRNVRSIGTDFVMRDGSLAHIRQRDYPACSSAFQEWLLATNGV